jgi:DNA-directed RNA polymerase specialized sigma24 family protein
MTRADRVAANQLSTTRKGRLKRQNYTFDRFGGELDEGLSDAPIESESKAEHDLLLAEIRIGCTLGMLLCLDRPHRLAYILGEIFEFEGGKAAQVLGIAPAAFRKRLSRARQAIIVFLNAKCGTSEPRETLPMPSSSRRRIKLEAGRSQRFLFAQSVEEAERFPEVFDRYPKT